MHNMASGSKATTVNMEGATKDAINQDEIRSRFEAAGQGHVLKHLESLSSSQKSSLLQELSTIEVENLSSLLQGALAEQQNVSEASDIEPFMTEVASTNNDEAGVISMSYQTGLDAIRRGEVAAITLAGGQGTRLGYDGPKGMYDIGLSSGKSLFCLIAERVLKLCQLASIDEKTDVTIPWYIMTSPLNHDQTVSYFESNSYFGLPPDSVRFFRQGMLPCLTPDEKIIMQSPSKVAMAPDGNGGIYAAMERSGTLADMKKRGVHCLHVFSIDNALVKPVDPVFVGYCLSRGADCGNKVLWKAHAHEKVGVMASKDGKPSIVEYSDITKDMAERVDDNGRLVFGAGNICNHYYTLDFIEKVVLPSMNNMFHVAHKKIPYHDESTNETITPTSNNGIKLESFIFDVFPLSTSMAVLEVTRQEEFAPVKNAPGSSSDSPDTARAMISALAKTWVRSAGGNLVGNVDSDACEISPLVSFAGEGLSELVKGKDVCCPFSF